MAKKWSSLVLAATMVVTLTACGSGNSGNGNENGNQGAVSPSPSSSSTNETNDGGNVNEEVSGTITVLTNRTDLIGNVYDEYSKRFNEKYPNAQVVFEAVTDYDKTAKIRLASGEYPDVMNIPTIANFELPEYYEALDDIGLNDRIRFKDAKAHEGKVYGITTGVDIVGIVYNKKAFADAGITEIPTTLDEFYAASEKLKANGVVPLASNFKDQWPLYPFSKEVPLAIAGNGNLYNERINSDAPYTMDGPFGQSMSIIREMYEKGYLEPDVNSTNWEQSKKDVASGKFAMYFLGQWVIPQVIDSGTTSDNIGFFPFPYDNEGGKNVIVSPGAASLGVNKNSKHIAAAKAFVKWFIEESGADADVLPILKDKEPTLAQLVEFESYNPNYIELVPDTSEATDVTNKAQITKEAIVQEFILEKDPQKVLDRYNEKWAKAKK